MDNDRSQEIQQALANYRLQKSQASGVPQQIPQQATQPKVVDANRVIEAKSALENYRKNKERNQLIEQGQPVSTQARFERTGKATPSVGGQLLRGVVEPFAQFGASAKNLVQAVQGKEQTDMRTNYLGDTERVGKGFDITSFSPESVKGALKAVGTGAEIGSYAIGALPFASVKGLVKPTISTVLKNAAVTEGIAGLVGGTGYGLRKMGDEDAPGVLKSGALGLGAGLVAGPLFAGVGRGLGNLAERTLKPTEFFTTRVDKNIRKLIENTTGDATQIENTAPRIKNAFNIIANDQNIKVPDTSQPIGSGATKPFSFENGTPNEFISAIQQASDNEYATNRLATENARSVNRTVKTKDIREFIVSAVKNKSITKAHGDRLLREIDNIGDDPVKAFDFVQDVNTKYGSKFDKGTIDDMATSKYANKVAEALRDQLNLITDRKAYGQNFGDLKELKKLVVKMAKKANADFNPSDMTSDLALDTAISLISGNPVYMARTFADSSFRNLLKSLRRKSSFGALRNVAKDITKTGDKPVRQSIRGGRDSIYPVGPQQNPYRNLPAIVPGQGVVDNTPIQIPRRGSVPVGLGNEPQAPRVWNP